MPIRINLKEIFPADSQEITVDKINFNFNKLLELGIGEEGPIGTAGPVGALGPIGTQGDPGERGNYWYVDSGDPNLLTFTDLVNGDLYLDSTQLAIWQWDESSSTWNFSADISSIINNYLTASPSPFRRGLGIGSSEDERFIIFNRRDDVSDVVPQSQAQNDILFLNNFDEDTISSFNFGPANPNTPPQISTDSLFNSLLAIYTNDVSIGRFHLNLGTLYNDSGDLKLTDVFQNLKVRYSRETGSVSPGLTNYTLTDFNLDLPEFSPNPINRTANGVFGFTTPKLYPASSINESTRTFIGSSYGLDEIVGISSIIKTDGLLHIDQTSQIYANLGLALNFTIPNIATSSANYLMLDGSPTISNILLNKNTIINGNLGILTTTPSTKLSIYDADSTDVEVLRVSSNGNSPSIQGKTYIGLDVFTDDGNRISPVRIGVEQTTGWKGAFVIQTRPDNNATQLPITRLAVMPNGNVGIGTTSPSRKLDIDSDSTTNTGLRIRGGSPNPGEVLVAEDTNGNVSWKNDGVPTGTIVMWGGAANFIPTGWQLCDGGTATVPLRTQLQAQGSPFGVDISGRARVPDLRDRFVVGARFDVGGAGNNTTNYNVGNQGGANEVTLTAGQIPEHTHSIPQQTITGGNHTHTYQGGGLITRGQGGQNTGGEPGNRTTTGTGAHSHVIPQHNTNTTGGGGSHENRPPYFALCFIIKHT